MRTLIVGDPHLQVGKIEEARQFCDGLVRLSQNVDQVILLGDLFHSFSVMRVEIAQLWHETFQRMNTERPGFGPTGLKVISLVGNHDMASDGGSHALSSFSDIITVVDRLTEIDGIYYAPFYRIREEFETMCRGLPSGSTLVCHQSFDGAQFDGGFYDPDGASLDSVKHLGMVIAGHVHKTQAVGNVWFPGTPFQQNFGEAGQKKYIFEGDLDLHNFKLNEIHNLKLPTYHNLDSESVKDLVLPEPDPNACYKIRSQGSPSDIAEFWKSETTKKFVSGSRRVVDAITSIRPADAFAEVKSADPSKRMEEYIKRLKWRTSAEDVTRESRRFISGD